MIIFSLKFSKRYDKIQIIIIIHSCICTYFDYNICALIILIEKRNTNLKKYFTDTK